MDKKAIIGIRREDKNKWERRAPLTPGHVNKFICDQGIEVRVQPSSIRTFKDEEYRNFGADITEDLSGCNVVFGIKEMPADFFSSKGTYVFFSHTIKGQKYNMPILAALMERACQLIDYENITDASGRRLIFFGNHAGLAGMIDTLWALGKRLRSDGIKNPFEKVKPAHEYEDLEEAKLAVSEVGLEIADGGLPRALSPFVCGFAGYGNVSSGAQEIYDLLPVHTLEPHELVSLHDSNKRPAGTLFKVVFREEHMVAPIRRGAEFVLQDYYDHPEKYGSIFERYIPYLTVLMNCIYWAPRYPRLLTNQLLRKMWKADKKPRLKVIGDISCDVEGAIQACVKSTTPDSPIFVYDPEKECALDGWQGDGPVILAVDNLPCELPRESSRDFSATLVPFVTAMAREDYSADFEQCTLPDEIRKAAILWKGGLTPDYAYLKKFLGRETPRD